MTNEANQNEDATEATGQVQRVVRCGLYNMKEGDVLHLGSPELYEVLRVPGGWIYTRFCENGTGGNDMSSCFVPFNDEFAGT